MRLGVAALTLCLSGCSFFQSRSQVRGNRVDPAILAELVPGTSTRTDVTSLLGTPTAHASFDDNTWLYIGSITRPVIAGTQHISHQETVAVSFDQNGILRDIATAGPKQAKSLDMVARVTPSPGSSASFMQQLLGNVGRFGSGSGNTQNTVGTAANGSGDNGDSSRFGTGQQ